MHEVTKGLIWTAIIAVGFYVGFRLSQRFPGADASSAAA